jgi:hypothetical protein
MAFLPPLGSTNLETKVGKKINGTNYVQQPAN